MTDDYPFPVVMQNGKSHALRNHVSIYSGYPVPIINRFIDSGELEIRLIGLQVYIDVEEALNLLYKSKFMPKRTALGVKREASAHNVAAKVDMFS
jgi:hypothetical protein